MEIHTIGIDLAKTVFHLVGLNAHGDVVVQRKCSRSQLLRFTPNLRVCLIGMEACGGAHFLGRALRDQGHDVRLMLAEYVKPYVSETCCPHLCGLKKFNFLDPQLTTTPNSNRAAVSSMNTVNAQPRAFQEPLLSRRCAGGESRR